MTGARSVGWTGLAGTGRDLARNDCSVMTTDPAFQDCVTIRLDGEAFRMSTVCYQWQNRFLLGDIIGITFTLYSVVGESSTQF